MRQRILTTKNISVLAILACLIVAVFLISLNTGTFKIPPIEVLKSLIGLGSEEQSVILFEFRMPRMVIAILVGSALAISGAIMQGLSRNPLADPGIIGINAGAGLTVVVFVYFFFGKVGTGTLLSVFILPLFALVGALLAAVIIYTLAWKNGVSSTRLILVGIAVAAGFGAVSLIFSMKMTSNDFRFATIWLAGSLWGTDWKFVLSALPWMLIFIPIAFCKAHVLNVMNLGDAAAVGLGLNVEKERRKLLFIAVCLAGASVAVAGGIGFIGLMAPHLARRLVGGKHQIMLPTAALIGTLLLLFADLISRSVLTTSEIPVGFVISIIGAPYFIYLLMRTK
ncbi:iron ABC transporter permease [Lysinibacillus sp. KCTC 33748]|uniref:FecCD family ABC transporter permease n=1 Tax=unclassified Lysinibacillus TaxID=2636778 RepID=UPI0009A5B4C4|nr:MULTISPECIES: iron ABC transporter permease [unclassified Lysinibacillus]OXS72793.1 iron ABC transporter permease [Lysinibacillus sp. KCTC 33748]SKB88646.1 iron complex transport system permease protein [Lysinibacillus sp. AC-3]